MVSNASFPIYPFRNSISFISAFIYGSLYFISVLEKKSQYKHRLAQKGTWMYKPAICMDTIISLHKDMILIPKNLAAAQHSSQTPGDNCFFPLQSLICALVKVIHAK